MNALELERKLIAAARANPPGDEVPYGFEQRLMARLKTLPALDAWSLWASALWRSAATCAALMLLLSAWTLLAPIRSSSSTDLSQELDNTVLAVVDQEPASDSL